MFLPYCKEAPKPDLEVLAKSWTSKCMSLDLLVTIGELSELKNLVSDLRQE